MKELPTMDEEQLRKAAICGVCGHKVGESGIPLFFRVRIERWGIKMDAIRRQTGLEMMLGSVALARVMGPAEVMATPMMCPVELSVCESCSTDLEKRWILAQFVEAGKPTGEITDAQIMEGVSGKVR